MNQFWMGFYLRALNYWIIEAITTQSLFKIRWAAVEKVLVSETTQDIAAKEGRGLEILTELPETEDVEVVARDIMDHMPNKVVDKLSNEVQNIPSAEQELKERESSTLGAIGAGIEAYIKERKRA